MDRGTVLGLLLAFGGVVLGVAMEGGHLGAYLSASSFMIVCVGSLGAMALAFPLQQTLRFGRCLVLLVRGRSFDHEAAIKHMSEIATVARRNGVLALEPHIVREPDDVIRAGLRMMVDGADTDVLESLLETKLEAHHYQGKQDEKMFETLGGFMPTMGIVGTVTSLIHVLGNLSEPSKLGAGIAAAFTATLYGVGIANLAVLPIAGKMRCLASEEADYYKMIAAGLVAIQSGDNPLWVDQKMRAFVPDGGSRAGGGGGGAAGKKDAGAKARDAQDPKSKTAAA